MNYAFIDALGSMPDNPDQRLIQVGQTVGFLEEAHRDALSGEAAAQVDEATWRSAWTGYALGSAADLVPRAGGVLSGAVDLAMEGWLQGETRAIEAELARQEYLVSQSRLEQLSALSDYWYDTNHDWAVSSEGYTTKEECFSAISGAANDGSNTAQGDPTNE